MIELSVRLVVAIGLLASALVLKQPSMPLAWELAAGFAAFSGLVYWAETKKLRNGGIAGFVAVLDAMFIATVAADAGQLENFGFLVLVPMVWATGRFGTDAASMSPLVAATVMVSSNFFERDGFTLPILFHTLGILVIGLLTNQAKVVLKETQVPFEVLKEVPVGTERNGQLESNYRTLKGHLEDLEKKARRDRTAMRVYVSTQHSEEPYFGSLAKALAGACDVGGAAVYVYQKETRGMVFEGYSGSVPKSVRDMGLTIPSGLSDAQMRSRTEMQIRELIENASGAQVATVLLKDKGRLTGLIALFERSVHKLDEGLQTAQEASDALGSMVADEIKREDFQRRLRETEILYGVASVTIGADTPQTMMSRIVRELGETVRVDHLGVFFLDGTNAIPVATTGASNRLFEEIDFGADFGIAGWIEEDAQETLLLDALDDGRIEKITAIKQRVGSYLMVPLLVDGKPYGFLTASTHSTSGIDSAKQGTLRSVAAEANQALNRLVKPGQDPEGVMTPTEFYGAVRAGRNGHLVYLEVLRREENVEKYGKPAYDLALRTLMRALRSKLPSGAAICRRDEGDYVVFLPTMDEESAREWSSEATATASLIGLSTPDGRTKIPLGLRAKVALLRPQKSQVSQEKTA